MPSRVKKFSGVTIERRLQKGFGCGNGITYRPWLRVSDVPSRGTSTVVTGWKHGREHHFLSQNERRYFLLLEWSDSVLDIREQFPLLPILDTQRIASSLGIRHPAQNGQPTVLTTDFMIIARVGDDLVHFARTVKASSELCNARQLEKFEIERCYYEERGIDWGIVVADDLPEALCWNIRWIHDSREIERLQPLLPPLIEKLASWLSQHVRHSKGTWVARLCSMCDSEHDVPPGTSLKVVRFLLARKLWRVEMNVRIDLHQPLNIDVRGEFRAGGRRG
jgi:TnsA endonuclease N terminal/TnsA endonuclease C terminal